MSNNVKVIIFNGPIGSGKDEAANYSQRRHDAFPFSFKEQLIKIVLTVYNITREEWDTHYTRDLKEQPWNKLDGKSPRQALIHMSEEVIKPAFGKDYFGRFETRKIYRMSESGCSLFVSSDGGFNEEIDPLIDMFGAENIFVVYLQRDGCSYKGDSRGYIENDRIPDQNYSTIYNNASLLHFYEMIDWEVNDIMRN